MEIEQISQLSELREKEDKKKRDNYGRKQGHDFPNIISAT